MNGKSTVSKKIQPVLRWAGGKRWLIQSLKDFLPKSFRNYHEPFLGGCSVFLSIEPKSRNYLSDLNCDLINFYIQVRDNLPKMTRFLSTYKNEERFYYVMRSRKVENEIESAAKFYYLNKTCFNGIYRVNSNGDFNVPFGFRENINLVETGDLKKLKNALTKNVVLKAQDFEDSMKPIKKGDLIFLDPPYTVAHNNNGFIEYNQKIFSWNDQERLADCIKNIKKLGAYFILTNAVHNSIVDLYKNIGKRYEIERYSTISGQMKDRKKVSEFIITNCI